MRIAGFLFFKDVSTRFVVESKVFYCYFNRELVIFTCYHYDPHVLAGTSVIPPALVILTGTQNVGGHFDSS